MAGAKVSKKKRIEQLLRYHETTRLLIRDLESRHLALLMRVIQLEEEKLT